MAAKRILLIEDETCARDAMASLLTEEGYTVCTAGSGSVGLQRVDDFHPDTVVCDFRLPDIDGLQVLRRVRAALGHGVRFIVVTAGCGSWDAEDRVRREADAFLQKPVNLTALGRLLRQPA
jgi:DNA-binding response OmpR family regulator